MPATIDPDAHRFNYVNGTTDATQRAGMTEGGGVWIHTEHWLAKIAKEWLPPAGGGQNCPNRALD